MADHSNLVTYLRSNALNERARICMGVTLFRGCDIRTLADLLGIHKDTALRLLRPLVADKTIGRTRKGHAVHYHSSLAAKKLVRAELRRLRCEGANLERELRVHPRIKLDKLDKLLGIVPDVES